ncbi:phasin family protein [Geminicoccus flavidas]|uniref:phasin family protein n=1 Tax=Geminicoccus flavidas TaxID=2506407 RepID=UPI00135A16B5|nr:phasin family protein [Geminicoccus flavidas]
MDGSNQLLTWWHAWLRLPLTLSAESLRFASRRCAAHADNVAALARCTSVREAAELQSGFTQRLLADYRDEAEVLMREASEAVLSSRAA